MSQKRVSIIRREITMEEKDEDQKVILNLRPEETLGLTDSPHLKKTEAFLFLKEYLKPQLDQATRDH
jgi:hypothetical protein